MVRKLRYEWIKRQVLYGLLDQLPEGCDSRTALDCSGLIGDLKRALVERMLNAEMEVRQGS